MKPLQAARYALETALVYAVYGFFRVLPLDAASNIGGAIGRAIGPRLPSTATARKNLALAFPEKTAAEHEAIVRGMWDNLGRVAAEYAHLHRITARVEIVGGEHFDTIRASGRPAIFCAAHIANWEIGCAAAKARGIDVHLVYRKPNNPWVDSLLRHARDAGAMGHIEKNRAGMRDMLAVIRAKGALGLLLDQRLNEGIALPFFGHAAMTAPAMAQMALRHDCPVYPARVERLVDAEGNGCRFRLTIEPPLAIPATGDAEADVREMMTAVNQRIEAWVRAHPEQWLWIHRRWG